MKTAYPVEKIDQAVIVGRYAKPGAAKVTLSGTLGDKKETYTFPANLTANSPDDTNSFIAKLWAARRVGEIIDELDLKGRNEELIKELVALATKHGILTQYTSFLADENGSNFGDLASNMARSRDIAEESLKETRGRYGFSQRAAKSNFKSAPQADASSIGGFGGGGFDKLAASEKSLFNHAAALGNAVYFDARSDKSQVATNILQRGRKTFFRQEGRWIDSTLTKEQQNNTQKIKRFSPAYFDLVTRYGQHVGQYLAIDEPVVVELGGEVYEW